LKAIKITLTVLIALVIILVVAFFGYSYYQKPKYEGETIVKNISKSTEVYFDDFGIPHIYSQNQQDAMVALGYVHAQERLWQMELMRRIAPGKLSEIFGSKLLKTDMFFAGLGINEASEKAIARLDKNSETYKMSLAYLDGLNQYLENGKTPVEFSILGIKKQKFTLLDVYNTFGFMAFSFAMAQKTDPLLTDIKNQLGQNYLVDLGVNYEFNTTKIHSNRNEPYAEIAKAVAYVLEKTPAAPFVGSNAWVVGSEKTKSGRVLFCNDPHIEYSQPGTWFEAHISCPNYEMYGFYVAGTPFPLLGHNRNFAYGLTMFENDDADFFQEEQNPENENQYKTPNGFVNYKIINKTIKVKDSAAVSFAVKLTNNGPIINNLLADFKSQKPVSLSWIYLQQNGKILESVYGLSHSKNIIDFKESISLITAPGLNVMYGDAKNNIAWFTSGKLYKHEKGVNPNFILDANDVIQTKKTFLNFDENPRAINPENHYVYSSNNMPDAIEGYEYPGYYLPEDRAKSIISLLNSKSNWTQTDMEKMLLNNTSLDAVANAQNMMNSIELKKLSVNETLCVKILKSWQGTNSLSDVAPTIYNKWIYFYLKNTFQDELGDVKFNQLLKTHVIKQAIPVLVKNQNSPWWDDISTKSKTETRSEILLKSFIDAVNSLTHQLGSNPNSWSWDKAHQLEIKHPLGMVAIFKPFFNIKSMPIAGSCEVINNTQFLYNDNRINEVKAGPSCRRIIDFSNIENGLNILPSGNSGNPFSKHYNDQAQLYAEGKFRKMMLNKSEIVKTSTKLVLKK
jgi:penicillin G amidase